MVSARSENLKRWINAVIIAFFVTLVVFYSRFIIWSPATAIVTHHLATDLYGHFFHVYERIQMLKSHFLPLGDYWMNFGGGYPAASNDQLIAQHELLMTFIYVITGSFEVALKIMIPIFYLATLITSYWYGMVVFKKRAMSVIFAVAFAFCTYGINQLEHLELVGVQPFIMLALIYLEKTFQNPKRISNQIWASLFMIFVFISNLYPMYFLLMYLFGRVVYQIIKTKQVKQTLQNILVIGIVALLMITPWILPQMVGLPNPIERANLGVALQGYSRSAAYFFYRNTPYVPYQTEEYVMYLGISVIILSAIPMLKRAKISSLYIFNLIVVLFFMLYSIGAASHFDLAMIVHNYFPEAYFIEVPGRAMVIGSLALSVCAALGFQLIYEKINKNWLKVVFVLLISLIVFADLTVGLEPPTMNQYFIDTPTYDWIKAQSGDFRIVELPSVHDQQAMTEIYTGHDTLSTILLGYGYFEPLQSFANVYNNYADLNESAQNSAFYGVKYIILNLTPSYYTFMAQAIVSIGAPDYLKMTQLKVQIDGDSNYKLVYQDGDVYTYQNLLYQGIVFGQNAMVQYDRINPDTIDMKVDATQATNIVISQCYTTGWVATITNNGQTFTEYPTNDNNVQMLAVNSGVSVIDYHYVRHEASLVNYALWWMATILVILALIFRKRWIYGAISLYGVIVMGIAESYNWQNNPKLYHEAMLGLGITLFVGGLFTLYLRRNNEHTSRPHDNS